MDGGLLCQFPQFPQFRQRRLGHSLPTTSLHRQCPISAMSGNLYRESCARSR